MRRRIFRLKKTRTDGRSVGRDEMTRYEFFEGVHVFFVGLYVQEGDLLHAALLKMYLGIGVCDSK